MCPRAVLNAGDLAMYMTLSAFQETAIYNAGMVGDEIFGEGEFSAAEIAALCGTEFGTE